MDRLSNSLDIAGKNIIPKTGDIIPFAGTSAPSGWAICDGTNGTPDLRGFFLVGALSAASIGSTYGSASHSHTTNVSLYTVNTAISSETHGYNSIFSGSTGGNSAGSLHSHQAGISTTSGSRAGNLVANSTTAGGPISFNNQPHAHAQGSTMGSTQANIGNHSHAGATVNMSTGGSHGDGHTITATPTGNLLSNTRDYEAFILMNYIMKL